MPKFQFRLATLLRLREATRDERRGRLAEAYRVDEVVEAQLESVAGELDWLRGRCRRVAGPGKVDVDQLTETQRYELALRAQQMQLRQQREQVAVEIERRRRALIAADRDVRVLEKLRDRQAENHRQTENRLEIKQLDEAAGLLAARKEAR